MKTKHTPIRNLHTRTVVRLKAAVLCLIHVNYVEDQREVKGLYFRIQQIVNLIVRIHNTLQFFQGILLVSDLTRELARLRCQFSLYPRCYAVKGTYTCTFIVRRLLQNFSLITSLRWQFLFQQRLCYYHPHPPQTNGLVWIPQYLLANASTLTLPFLNDIVLS